MNIWIDVTTSVGCPPPAVGIPRVESNIAEQLCAIAPSVRLCVYEAPLGRFSELAKAEFLRVRRAGASAGTGGRIELEVERPDRRASGGIDIFDPGDVLICCGLHWRPEFGNTERLYEIRNAIGLRLVTTCYDVIAVAYTHLVPGMEAVFEPYLRAMARHADHVLCISRRTRRDFLRWIDDNGGRVPETSVMPLGCELRAPAGADIGAEVAALLEQRYLLFVSTVENRKNHATLCRAYARLVDWGVRDLPLLVFVGALGEGGPALAAEIVADARLRGKIVLRSGVTDAELVALYERCLFTLYPSLYEGWGLPISESLACGKFCLASNAGALPEAGEEFVEYLDPLNVEEWANKIYRYLTIPGAVVRREHDIRQYFRPKRWRDSAEHVLRIASALTQNSV